MTTTINNDINNTNDKFTLDFLIYVIRCINDFELRRSNMPLVEYNKVIKQVNSNTYICTSCSSVIRQNHNNLQTFIWNKMFELYPEYVPEIGELKSLKYNTDFYKSIIRKNNYDGLVNLTVSIDLEIQTLRKSPTSHSDKNKEMIECLLNDVTVIRQFAKFRLFNYNEFIVTVDELKRTRINSLTLSDEVDSLVSNKKDSALETNLEGMKKSGGHNKIDIDIELAVTLTETMTMKEVADKMGVSLSTLKNKIKIYKENNNEKETIQ